MKTNMQRLKLVIVLFCALLVTPVYASTLFIESGGDATHGFEFWTSTAGLGGEAVSSTAPRTGPRNLRSVNNGRWTKDSVLSDAGRRINFAFLRENTPDFDSMIMIARTSGDSQCLGLALRTDNKIALWSNTTELAVSSTTLSQDTWYRVTVSYTITNGSTSEIRVFINGSQEISVSNGSGVTTGTSKIIFGVISGGVTLTLRMDDFYIDD